MLHTHTERVTLACGTFNSLFIMSSLSVYRGETGKPFANELRLIYQFHFDYRTMRVLAERAHLNQLSFGYLN